MRRSKLQIYNVVCRLTLDCQREREREREREKERDRDRQRETETERERQRQRERDRERQIERDTQRDRERKKSVGLCVSGTLCQLRRLHSGRNLIHPVTGQVRVKLHRARYCDSEDR